MPFYYDFMAYLNSRDYNVNSAGKIVKELKANHLDVVQKLTDKYDYFY